MTVKDTNPALPEPSFSGPYCCFCGASREPLDGSPGRHSAFCDTRTARHLAQPSPSVKDGYFRTELARALAFRFGATLSTVHEWFDGSSEPAPAMRGSMLAGLRMGQEKDINFPSTPAELTHTRALPRVTIIYFKPSGKYYTEDTNVEWPRDPTHHTGWAPLEALHRIKKMYAVCIENPHGFPQFSSPRER